MKTVETLTDDDLAALFAARKVAPHEADAMLQALATHLRSAHPMTLIAAGGVA